MYKGWYGVIGLVLLIIAVALIHFKIPMLGLIAVVLGLYSISKAY